MNRTFHDSLDDTQPCRDDPALFFPTSGESNEPAKQICRACAFQPACLAYALTYDLYGIWGGTTQKERRAYQRDRSIRTTPVVPLAVRDNPTRPGRPPAARRSHRKTS